MREELESLTVNKENLVRRIKVAAHNEPADLVIKNGKVIDVFSGQLLETDVAIADGMIVGLGDYEADEILDAQGRYICPALIDAHVHIESSLLTPGAFSDVLAARGVTAAITDPHEIANVLGADGIRFMLERAKESSIDLYVMLPSSVPATSFEHNGATLEASDLEPLFNHAQVLVLAEVMDFPAVLNAEPEMVDKLTMTLKHSWRIDGHAAGLDARGVNIYKAAGIRTDHECVSIDEAKDRLARGMYVMIRQGTVAKDLPQLISLVNETNSRRFLFCTDDKYPDDLISEGSVDHNVRMAIKSGLDPITCIKMASLNPAECYGFREKGAVAPGYEANFLLLDDLEQFSISKVYAHGKLIAENGQSVHHHTHSAIKPQAHPLKWPALAEDALAVPLGPSHQAHVIGIIPNSLVTRDLVEQVPEQKGHFVHSPSRDYVKMAVIERHKGLGTLGTGIVKGFGMKSGAIATTIAHDSHNLVVAGCSDSDMIAAAEHLKVIDGGMVVVKDGKVLAELALPIAGLMTDSPASEAASALKELNEAAVSLGVSDSFNPFLTLSFLSLPVIPDLKLTDTGLFDVRAFKHISVSID
ncbi:adenine deaminase [Sporolactobacillus inulinus]|uniref:Adenine deaminase n=1 Tax=Sporolactobacillus inulinus CASD TaxID=1069536 RepID=A0A0U1QPS7_9BACL|nr:adenine deaminase [Sporolactobacillus inulinus]KLI02813.1 adenine deaminase [Sporolactobacillus inulinus CASD]